MGDGNQSLEATPLSDIAAGTNADGEPDEQDRCHPGAAASAPSNTSF